MDFSLNRLFQRGKSETASAAAVAPRPPIEKPASERFGKTVLPKSARVLEPETAPVAASFPQSISLGENRVAREAKPRAAVNGRTIALPLSDLLAQIPADLLEKTEVDPEQRLLCPAAELERGMAKGRPVILLRSIFQQAPSIFAKEISATDDREIALPFQTVLEQFAQLHVRHDQETEEVVPQVETPFLKATLEDSEKFGAPSPIPRPAAAESLTPLPPNAEPAVAVAETTPKPAPRAPIRLAVPETSTAPPAKAATPSPLPRAELPKISLHGAGALTPERVPASSESPVPTPLPAPLAPPAPARIPFKVTPPASDLCPPPALPLRPAEPMRVPLRFSEEGPRLRLSLRNILRGIPPFQLAGPIEDVPEDAQIEAPFSIVAPQLSLGRVAISPAQFQAAMPEQYRSLYKLDEGGLPVSLPLAEILENLPNESLRVRPDQEAAEVPQVFETAFSQKAAEDAARLKTAAGPIGPQATASAVGEAASLPATLRNALQITFETDEPLDAKAVVAHVSRLPGLRACAIICHDGLSLAGNIPAEYEAEGLCAVAPEIVRRIDEQMKGTMLGARSGITVFCAKAPVSFFAHDHLCLVVLHSGGELAPETRARLTTVTEELARIYAAPPNEPR